MPRMAKPSISSAPTLMEAADMWRVSLRSAGKAEKTVTTYLYAADRLAAQVGWTRQIDRITRTDHEAMQAALLARMKPASVSTVYRSLRSFWKFAVEHDELPVGKDPMNGMPAPTVPETTVQFVTDDELRAVLKTCQSRSRHNYLGHRDEAILRLLMMGARLSEVATLTLRDIDLIDGTFEVLGKASRPRSVPMGDAVPAVRRYLDHERPRHPSAKTTDAVWLARAGAMTPNGIAQMVSERGIKAGIGHRVHPHELRHRFVATRLGAGMSEGDVMALTGHRSRSMMDRYGRFTRAQRAHEAERRLAASGALSKV